MRKFKGIAPGLLLTIGITIVSIFLHDTAFNQNLRISSLLYAIIIGMLISNLFPSFVKSESMKYGLKFASRPLLRLGVIFLGFKIGVHQLTDLGISGLLYTWALTIVVLVFTLWVAKIFKLPHTQAVCIAAGSAICGASAVAAVGPIVHAKEEETAFGIGAITLFGTIVMFVMPLAFTQLGLNEHFYGSWVGLTLPEVAEVTAAGGAVGSDFAESQAILVKLTRVLMLVPISIFFAFKQSKIEAKATGKLKVNIPWYVLFFILVVIFHSSTFDSETARQAFPAYFNAENLKLIKTIGAFILTIAMASLGLKTNLNEMRKAGARPLYVGLIAAIFIQILGLFGAYFFLS